MIAPNTSTASSPFVDQISIRGLQLKLCFSNGETRYKEIIWLYEPSTGIFFSRTLATRQKESTKADKINRFLNKWSVTLSKDKIVCFTLVGSEVFFIESREERYETLEKAYQMLLKNQEAAVPEKRYCYKRVNLGLYLKDSRSFFYPNQGQCPVRRLCQNENHTTTLDLAD
jgi:hypothetical protein